MAWPVRENPAPSGSLPAPSASPPALAPLGVWGQPVVFANRGSLPRRLPLPLPPVPQPFSLEFSPRPQPGSAGAPARVPARPAYSSMLGRRAPRPQTAGPRLGEPVVRAASGGSSSPELARPVAQYPAGTERKGSPEGDESRRRGARSTDSQDSSDDGWSQVSGRERARSSVVSRSSGAAASAGPAHLPGVLMLNPLDIRWSQATVSCCLSDRNKTIAALSEELASPDPSLGWHGAPILVVRMPDGKLTSSDNRRLTAAVLALTMNSEFRVPAEIHEWNELTGQPLRNFIRPDHENPGEKMMPEEAARTMLKTFSILDPSYQLQSDREASHADAIFMKMFGKISSAKTAGVAFQGDKFGYKMIPRVVPMFEDGTDRHRSIHVFHRGLQRKLDAAMKMIFVRDRPHLLTASASSRELDPCVLSKSALKRAKARERARSTGSATPGVEGEPRTELVRQDNEGRFAPAARAAAAASEPRPVTAPPTSG